MPQMKELAKDSKDSQLVLDEEEALHFNQEDAILWLEPFDGRCGFLNDDRVIVA